MEDYFFVKAQKPIRESVALITPALRQVLGEMRLGFPQAFVRRDDWPLWADWIGKDVANEVLVTIIVQPELLRGLLVQIAKFNIRLSDAGRERRIEVCDACTYAFEQENDRGQALLPVHYVEDFVAARPSSSCTVSACWCRTTVPV